MADPRSPLTDAFAAVRPTYEAFTASLTGVIRTIAEIEGIEIAQIECRTKTLDSFEEKVGREDKRGKYKAYTDLTDLTGIRIVTYLPTERDALIGHLRDAMMIDETNSRVVSDEIDPDRFGYQSTHLVLSYPPERLALPEFKRFADMRAEIQVRTVLQHAWAAIDWKLRYKNAHETPRLLRRRLYRISALLESADDDFTFLNEQITALREKYEMEIKAGDLDIELNLESLTTFLDLETSDRRVAVELRQVVSDIANLEILPPKFSFNYLLKEASARDIATVAQLEDRLLQALAVHRDTMRSIYEAWSNTAKTVQTNLPDMARLALLLTDDAAVQADKLTTMFAEGFRTSVRQALKL